MKSSNHLKNIQGNRHLQERYDLMTYILGARCKDGVVIVADRKGIIGNTSVKMQKIRHVKDLGHFGFSGTEQSFNDFYFNLKEELRESKPESREDEFLLISKLVRETNEKFKRTGDTFELLFAYYNNGTKKIELKHISEYGGISDVYEEQAIGSGWQMGQIFVKTSIKSLRELNIDDMSGISSVGISIIYAIENLGLDENVGFGFDICMLPDTLKGDEIMINKEEMPEVLDERLKLSIKSIAKVLTFSKDDIERLEKRKY